MVLHRELGTPQGVSAACRAVVSALPRSRPRHASDRRRPRHAASRGLQRVQARPAPQLMRRLPQPARRQQCPARAGPRGRHAFRPAPSVERALIGEAIHASRILRRSSLRGGRGGFKRLEAAHLGPRHAQQDATLRTMALGTLILNAFSVRAAPGRFIRCRCSPKQCADKHLRPRRPGATSSLLSCLPNRAGGRDLCPSSRSVISGIVDSGREDGLGNIDARDPEQTSHAIRSAGRQA